MAGEVHGGTMIFLLWLFPRFISHVTLKYFITTLGVTQEVQQIIISTGEQRMNTFILELLIQHLLAGRTDGDCKYESSRLDWKHMRRWQTVYEILECKGSLTADNLVIIWASGETWSKLHHEWLNSELYWFKLVMTNESCAMCSVVWSVSCFTSWLLWLHYEGWCMQNQDKLLSLLHRRPSAQLIHPD